MPGIVRGAVPVGTLPFSLSTQFSENHAIQIRMNEYADGSCQRSALVNQGRRSWKISKRLTASQLEELYQFFLTNRARAFYFYNPSETIPPFSPTPSGSAGRYIVRFASDWSQTAGLVRSDVGIEIIEIAGDQDIGAAAPVTNEAVPGQATIHVVSAHIPNSAFTPFPGVGISTGPISLFIPADMVQSSGAWTKREDTKIVNFQTWGGIVVAIMDHFGGGTTTPLVPPDELQIYDCWCELVYGDGSVVTTRPTSAAPVINRPGGVANPGNAIDGDANSFASITCISYPTNSLANGLILGSFQ